MGKRGIIMMSRITDIARECLSGKDEIQCILPIQHERTAGYMLLSKEKMIFVDEEILMRQDRFSHGSSRPPFQIPLWAIFKIETNLDYKNSSNPVEPFAVILNDGDAYIFRSLFSSEIKRVFDDLKSEEQYIEVSPTISQA